jgi:hypothetical protein
MNLEQYKELLDYKTYDAMGEKIEEYSRYYSFKYCLDYLSKLQNIEVLELGTCRSFVDGAYEGCNSDDSKYWNKDDFSRWDWGAGCFSLIFGRTHCNLTTVDIIVDHIRRCKIMTDSLGIKCDHVVNDSINFLQNTNKKFDLIYLDTGDMWPIEPTANLQLQEAKTIYERNLIKSSGIILIDDVKNKTPQEYGDTGNKLGKSKYSLDYLLSHNFKLVFEGYQYILQKI